DPLTTARFRIEEQAQALEIHLGGLARRGRRHTTVSPRRPRGLRPRRQTKRSKVLYGTCTPRSPSNSCTRVNCKCSSCSHVVICSRYGSNRSACGDAHVRGALTTRPTWTNRTTCSS